ncbi:hypothetical protein HDU96_005562 [Phlyctochytrium bullatum]|nr:hypothetical protein HDU96_005562 [Phlyctochytrium bullatum]
MPTSSPPPPPPNFDIILRHLRRIVAENQLQCLWPDEGVVELAGKLARIDFTRLSTGWNIPREIIVFFCDDSGSMQQEEGGSRIDDLRSIIERVAEFACALDEDGISVRFMNSPLSGDHLRTHADIHTLLSRVPFTGLTPLGTQLHRRVIDPLVLHPAHHRHLRKPVLVLIITDGEPVGEPRHTVQHVILHTHTVLAQMGLPRTAVAFGFAQCGTDRGAQRFLEELDRDPQIGGQIDCTSYYESEAEEMARKGLVLTPEMFLVKLCVGAIDSSYDAQDE